jgi:integrase
MSFKDSPSVKNWLSRISPNSHRARLAEFKQFMNWVRVNGAKFAAMSPDELVEYQKAATNGTQYDVLDLVEKYILSCNGRRLNTKRTKLSLVKSFFTHNRAPLPSDPSFNLRGDTLPVQGKLSPDDVRRVVLSSTPMYQSVFLCMLSGGMDQESLIYWSDNGWPKLREDLKGDPDFIKVDLPGRKRRKNETPFYTLIGGDALDSLKKWVKVRPPQVTSIFTGQRADHPLGKFGLRAYWQRHLRRLGLIPAEKGGANARYGRNPHEARDLFRTLWSKSGAAPQVAEYLMGHATPSDAYMYDKSYLDEKFVKKEYRKALPFLNIMSGNRAYGQISEDRVAELEAEVDRLRKGQSGEVTELKVKMENMEKAFAKVMKALRESK